MFKKILSAIMALVMIAAVATMAVSCGPKANDDPSNEPIGEKGMTADLIPVAAESKDFEIPSDFKIGVICLHDENSTYDLNFINAIKDIKTAFGLTDEQVLIKRNIPEANDCYEAAKDLVASGCKVVFADSFGYESYLLKAAKEYPDVQFCHATGTSAHVEKLANFHNAFASIYEGRYLAGIAAGLKLNELKAANKLKSDVPTMGYVGAFTYAEVISGYTSFYLGAKSVCPDVVMKVQFTGSWYDESEEKSAAQALIAAGCDLISQHADSLGAPTACEDAGIPNVSYNGSTFDAGENTFIISSAINWRPYFAYIIKSVSTNTAMDYDYTGTIATGSVVLSGLNTKVAAEGTKEAIETAIAGFAAGTLNVFATDTFKVGGAKLDTFVPGAATDGAFDPATVIISDGVLHESEYRSAPYFDATIDGITLLNSAF